MYPGDARRFFLFLLPLLVSAVVNLMSDDIVICFVCVYNTCCPLYELNRGIKLISIIFLNVNKLLPGLARTRLFISFGVKKFSTRSSMQSGIITLTKLRI